MIGLSEYVECNLETPTNEGLIKDMISIIEIKKIDPQTLLTGILNMYDYICDEDDINLFYQDYPLKQRVFWKNMYEMYKKKVWSIFDISQKRNTTIHGNRDKSNNVDQVPDILSELGISQNEIVDVTPQLRRQLRNLINESRNNKLELKPGEIKSVLAIRDDVKNVDYILTLNRTTGFLNKLFRAKDIKFLELALKRMGVYKSEGKINIEDSTK